jgi:hypothetical protein
MSQVVAADRRTIQPTGLFPPLRQAIDYLLRTGLQKLAIRARTYKSVSTSAAQLMSHDNELPAQAGS